MALHQTHEQNNATIKSDGGVVRLTQSPKASLEKKHKKPLDTSHHKQTKSFQVTFGKQVKKLVDVMEEMGNPFL